jgi:phage baseplate assembly protein W
MRINNPDYIFWKDIDIWIRPNVYGDVTDQVNKYAILNSIYNILSTEQGTRRMRPEFAINLKHLLFEPMDDDTASQVSQRIASAIQRWEPRVRISQVNVVANYDQQTYVATLIFEILKSNEQITLNFPIKKL